MLAVLHAGLLDGRLTVWAEREREPFRPPGLPRLPLVQAHLHPFAASEHELLRAVSAAILPGRLSSERSEHAWAWVPTHRDEPVPSTPLVADPPPARAQLRLAPWAVPSLLLEEKCAIHLLRACTSGSLVAPGVVAGTDLEFWAHALRLAAFLVLRASYRPALCFESGAARAYWQPLFTPDDDERLGHLAQAMPPAARALAAARETAPPSLSPRHILEQFISNFLDHLVRSSAVHSSFPSEASSEPLRQWLRGLQTAGGLVEAQQHEFVPLIQAAEATQECQAPTRASYRLCLQLEEALPPHSPWRLRYLVQDLNDLSLKIPAEAIWHPRAGHAARRARQFLRAALARAAALYPDVAASLREKEPTGCLLDVQRAYAFLAMHAAELEQAGFGVLLPAWWSNGAARQRLTQQLRVEHLGGGPSPELGLDRLVAFHWEVALGGQALSRVELEELARLKAPLVRVRGQWIEVSTEQIRAALASWDEVPRRATVRELVRRAPAQAGPLEFAGIVAEGPLGALLSGEPCALEMLEAPRGFLGMLRPYQERGLAWLATIRACGVGGCLADDMGLGKTVQLLALVQHAWERGERKPVLLVCPTSVISNWQREAARFTPNLPLLVYHGVRRRRESRLAAELLQRALVITSYTLLHRDRTALQRIAWAGVVLDEAQSIKNPETRQARAARALRARYRLALTGTPVENHVGELWSLMEFLNPALLGSHAAFRKSFVLPIQTTGDSTATKRLRQIIAPFVLRRLKTDRAVIEDLPAKLEQKIYCTLTREQVTLYQAVLSTAEAPLRRARGMERRGLVLATLTKLKQVCNHPAQLLGDGSPLGRRSGKLNRLTEMLEEVLAAAECALVFTQYAAMGELLARHLRETFATEVLFLHGATPRKQRDELVRRFQARDGPSLFLLSLKAGGIGLNLTRANHVFHFDRWWNPAIEHQATDRSFRIGQTRPVLVHKLICAGTCEESIDELIERKQRLTRELVTASETWLTELEPDELRRLLALRPLEGG